MNDETRIQQLQQKLAALDAKRKRIKAELDAIMLKHIEVQHVQAEGEGDAIFFSMLTKARLMQILEEHWSIHHQFAIDKLELHTKADLVNLVLSVKGLPGHYEAPERKAVVKSSSHRTKNVWRS